MVVFSPNLPTMCHRILTLPHYKTKILRFPVGSPGLIFAVRQTQISIMVTWITFAALLTSLSLTGQRSLVKAAVQCGQAGSQVSCHASSPINPDSDETCCFNGALKKGDKESGLVLSTQVREEDVLGRRKAYLFQVLWHWSKYRTER